MMHLKIREFSCLKSANVDFSRLTVLVGPQASGKSVVCKLAYFFIDILQDQNIAIDSKESYDDYKKRVAAKFIEWFPPSAWGKGKFAIEFSAGQYSVSLTRKTYSKTVKDDFNVRFSPEFEEQYKAILQQVEKLLQKAKAEKDDFYFDWEMRRLIGKSIESLLGKEHSTSQIFIPAGRSFFTSIGKAVAAFEHGGILDPLIVRFGRVYSAYKEHRVNRFYFRENRTSSHITDSLAHIFGGKLVLKGDTEFVECADGRQIPMSALSSGQQELLPLVAVLPFFGKPSKDSKSTLYIEEPEAHLFPSAQSKLMEVFANMLSPSPANDLILTTHSPYVLAKINNLIKAGQLGRTTSEAKRNRVNAIIPKTAWLTNKSVRAYAIRDGEIHDILEDDGLINSDYLDEVSNEISKEFLRLLEVEVQS